jgi:hypothetical protein
MLNRIRNVFLIVLVTLLVWIYAEAESLTRSQQEVRVSFVSGADDLATRVVSDDWRGVVRVRLEGSAASLQQTPPRIELRPGSPGVPDQEGEYNISLADALRNDPDLQRAGVNVIAVEPPTVRLRIDTLRRIDDAPVRVALSGVDLEQPARIDPATADLILSRPIAEQLEAIDDGAFVLARVDPAQIDMSRRGLPQRVRATLSLPNGITANGGTARITPPECIVEIVIRRDTATITVPSAPVQVLLPPTEAGRWEVRILPEDLFLREIEITGPSEFVNQVRANDVRLVAVLSLSSDELERGITEKRASLATLRDGMIGQPPPGARIEARDPLVRFEIVRRETGPVSGASVEPATALFAEAPAAAPVPVVEQAEPVH